MPVPRPITARETEPERPSTAVQRRAGETGARDPRKLRRRLAGDLDSIVLKALRLLSTSVVVSAAESGGAK